jgi:hypothetical protein
LSCGQELIDELGGALARLDELDAHARRVALFGAIDLAPPHDAPHAVHQLLILGDAHLELEQRASREGRARLDEDAAAADVVRVVLDELVYRRALVAHCHVEDASTRIFAISFSHAVRCSGGARR